jgi:hypothetical protein
LKTLFGLMNVWPNTSLSREYRCVKPFSIARRSFF